MTSSVDILISLGSVQAVRNFLVGGVVQRFLDCGHRVGIATQPDLIDLIEEFLGNPDGVTVAPLPTIDPQTAKLLTWARTASFVSRREKDEYRRRLKWLTAEGLGKRLGILKLILIDRLSGNVEKFAGDKINALSVPSDIREVLDCMHPKVLLWPYMMADSSDFELIHGAKQLGIPVIMCEGSWDNFTTKGALWPRPDRILSWGPYSRRQALAEHGFTEDEVIVTGPPHFDVYGQREKIGVGENWRKEKGLDPVEKVILFARTTQGKFNHEAKVVKWLSSMIEDGTLPRAIIWYRSHPRFPDRGDRDGISGLPHVRIDPGTPSQSGHHLPWDIHRDNAVQRARVLQSCDILVSTFSTLVIEAALFGKPSVLLAFVPDAAKGGKLYPA